MAWGTVQTMTAVTLTSTWQDIGTISTTNATDIIDLQLQGVYQASPANNINWQLLGSVDGTTFDGLPVAAAQIVNTASPPNESITISGYKTVKLQGQIDGTTDTTDTLAAAYVIG